MSWRTWRATISQWPNTYCIRHTLVSWRSEASRARENRRSHSVLRRRSVPSLVRWCCAATRRGSVCAVCLVLQRLGPEGYSSQVSERVYSTLAEQAALILREGHSVVVDAVYARAADRRVIEQVAEAASVPFTGLWLDAPESLLIERTAQRRNDASDADARSFGCSALKTPAISVGVVLTHRQRQPRCCHPRWLVCASDSVTARLIRKKSSRRLRALRTSTRRRVDMGSDTTNTRKQLPEPGVPPSRTLRQQHTPIDCDGSRRGIRGLARPRFGAA